MIETPSGVSEIVLGTMVGPARVVPQVVYQKETPVILNGLSSGVWYISDLTENENLCCIEYTLARVDKFDRQGDRFIVRRFAAESPATVSCSEIAGELVFVAPSTPSVLQ